MHTRSESSSQHLTPVNCASLDAVVLEYLAKEGLIEDADANDDQVQLTRRQAASAAYQQLFDGDIQTAVAIVQKYCPDVVQDQRLTFKLKRQQFIELLRQATATGDAAALACARDELAPLALDAYPEAYLDFKKALLMLVQPVDQQQQQQQQPPTQQKQQQQQEEDWSLEARHRLAEVVYHTMLHQIGWSGPQLTQQLVYLLQLFALYTSGSHGSSSSRGSSGHTAQIQQLLSSPEADLVDGLLLTERDEGPLPPDVSGQGYAERDVQALMSAVSLPRSAAMNALKAAAGDVSVALRHELLRFRVNKQQLDLMAWEYAAARNLLEPLENPPAAAASAAASAAAAAADMDVDTDGAPSAAAAAAATMSNSKSAKRSKAAVHMTDGPVASAAHMAAAGSTGRGSSPFETAAAAEQQAATEAPSKAASAGALGSTAAASVDGSLLRSDSQSPPYKVPRWRSKQTPSRFCGQKPAPPPAAAAAAATGGNRHELPPVVVCSNHGHQQHSSTTNGNPSTPQPQRRVVDNSIEGSVDAIVQQVHDRQQQQRWQQLQQQLKSQAAASGASSRQMEVQQSLQRLQALVNEGEYQAVEDLLEEIQPGLLQEYPVVRFDIKRLQFIKLVQGNDFPAALQLVRGHLTPLADNHPELLPSLKANMALLLPGRSNSSSSSSPDTDDQAGFLAMLLPLLQARLGVEAPMLVKLFRVLLTGHKGWFRIQRCQDPFIGVLELDKLLQCETPFPVGAIAAGSGTAAAAANSQQGTADANSAGAAGRAAARPGSAAAALTAAARQALLEDPLDLNGEVHMDVEEDAGPDYDEGAVLQVMEVLELPRAAALELLAEHGGDAQAAIMQVFG